MRRAILTILFLVLLAVPAQADTTWMVEGDRYTDVYTQTQTSWGYIVYRESEDGPYNYVDRFKYDGCVFDVCDDYVWAYDEIAGRQTFYRGTGCRAMHLRRKSPPMRKACCLPKPSSLMTAPGTCCKSLAGKKP